MQRERAVQISRRTVRLVVSHIEISCPNYFLFD